jgi:phenylacetate-coenzyme A ligase PaaK-like adenylate-forming protein
MGLLWQAARLARDALAQRAVLRWSPERIASLQRDRLQALVAHARAASPFHAERLRHVDPGDFELGQLPTMTKAQMMADFDRVPTDRRLRLDAIEGFLADPNRLGEWFLGEYAVSRTSGTQGVPAIIVQDRRMMERLFAVQMGRTPAFPISPLGAVRRLISPARVAVVTIGRGFFPSAAALAYEPPAAEVFLRRLWIRSIEPMATVVARLDAFRPQVLVAYAGVLELLAREAMAGRLHLRAGDPLRQVMNMSEPMSDGAQSLIEGAFGLPVTNNYATGECMALSLGCPSGHGMHLQADWAVLEVVDRDNRPVPAGQPGEKVLITNLYNFVQPFIRYEVDDVATLSPGPCPCGNPMPLIVGVEGRSDEVTWIRDRDAARAVHPYVFVDVLDECPELGRYQLMQEEPNRYRLRAAAAPGRRLDADQLDARLRDGLRRHGLEGLIRVDVELADRVDPDPVSGKLKRITSRLRPPVETV